jgi:hypothetical protein
VTRRVSLPGADELFRSTVDTNPVRTLQDRAPVRDREVSGTSTEAGQSPQQAAQSQRSGVSPVQEEPRRVGKRPAPKHDQKVTFYCTDEELTRLERARLSLRADHRLACDRGRLVRAALAEVLAEFESNGRDSRLVRRLRGATDR